MQSNEIKLEVGPESLPLYEFADRENPSANYVSADPLRVVLNVGLKDSVFDDVINLEEPFFTGEFSGTGDSAIPSAKTTFYPRTDNPFFFKTHEYAGQVLTPEKLGISSTNYQDFFRGDAVGSISAGQTLNNLYVTSLMVTAKDSPFAADKIGTLVNYTVTSSDVANAEIKSAIQASIMNARTVSGLGDIAPNLANYAFKVGLSDFEPEIQFKTENITQSTSKSSIASLDSGVFNQYLGNNGLMELSSLGALTKSVDKQAVVPGDTIKYIITATNTTDEPVIDGVLEDQLPEGLELISVPVGMELQAGNKLVAQPINLQPGESRAFEINARVLEGVVDRTILANTAYLSSGALSTQSSTTDTVVRGDTGEPAITKTVDKNNAQPGDTLRYTIRVDNPTGEAVQNVVVRDVYPADGVDVIEASITAGGVHNNLDTPPTIIWTIPEIEANSSVILSFEATVKVPTSPIVTNTNHAYIDEFNGTTPTTDPAHSADTEVDYSVTITASSSAGGSLSDEGETTLVKGSDKTYTISPEEHFELVGLKIDGTALGSAELEAAKTSGSYTFSNVLTDHTISAEFSRITHAVSTDLTNLTSDAAPDAPQGQDLVVTLTPEAGYKNPESIEVVIGTELLDPSEYAYDPQSGTITIPGDKITDEVSISGAGIYNQVTITASSSAGGSLSDEGETTLVKGSDKTYTISPEEHFELVGLKIDGTALGSAELEAAKTSGSYTFSNVLTDHTISAEFSRITHAVSTDLTNLTSDAAPDAPQGQDLVVTLTPEAGYKNPESIEVVIGTELLDPSEYAYDPQSGTITIPGDKITDEVSISGAGTPETPSPDPATHTVTATAGDNGSITPAGDSVVNEGDSQAYTITPDEGYEIDSVVVNGTALSGAERDAVVANASYTFDNIQDDSSISVTFRAKKYDVAITATNLSFPADDAGASRATHGADYSTTLTPEAGFKLPTTITVKVGGSELAAGSYTYDPATGQVVVPGSLVTGNIEIIATGDLEPVDPSDPTTPTDPADPDPVDPDPATHTVTATAGDNGSITPAGDSVVNEGDSQAYTITPDEGYEIDSVVVNGTALSGAERDAVVANASYTFDNIQDDSSISVTFRAKKYDVAITATNLSFPADDAGASRATHGADYSTTLTPEAGFKLPTTITVKVGGSELAAGSYTYDPATGQVVVPGSLVTGNIEIIATGDLEPVDPSDPTTPTDPADPDPVDPDQPPSNPEEPSADETETTTVIKPKAGGGTKTGDEANVAWLLSLMVLSLSSLAFVLYRRVA